MLGLNLGKKVTAGVVQDQYNEFLRNKSNKARKPQTAEEKKEAKRNEMRRRGILVKADDKDDVPTEIEIGDGIHSMWVIKMPEKPMQWKNKKTKSEKKKKKATSYKKNSKSSMKTRRRLKRKRLQLMMMGKSETTSSNTDDSQSVLKRQIKLAKKNSVISEKVHKIKKKKKKRPPGDTETPEARTPKAEKESNQSLKTEKLNLKSSKPPIKSGTSKKNVEVEKIIAIDEDEDKIIQQVEDAGAKVKKVDKVESDHSLKEKETTSKKDDDLSKKRIERKSDESVKENLNREKAPETATTSEIKTKTTTLSDVETASGKEDVQTSEKIQKVPNEKSFNLKLVPVVEKQIGAFDNLDDDEFEKMTVGIDKTVLEDADDKGFFQLAPKLLKVAKKYHAMEKCLTPVQNDTLAKFFSGKQPLTPELLKTLDVALDKIIDYLQKNNCEIDDETKMLMKKRDKLKSAMMKEFLVSPQYLPKTWTEKFNQWKSEAEKQKRGINWFRVFFEYPKHKSIDDGPEDKFGNFNLKHRGVFLGILLGPRNVKSFADTKREEICQGMFLDTQLIETAEESKDKSENSNSKYSIH